MLIEFIPVMLFILGWSMDDPGDISLQRHPVLYASIEECEKDSPKVLADMATVTDTGSAPQFMARCLPIPDRSEFDELFKREFNQPE